MGALDIHVRLTPPETPATNDMRQFYVGSNMVVFVESIRAHWPTSIVPRVIVQRVRDHAVLAPSLTVVPDGGAYEIRNTSDRPQLVVGQNRGMHFHTYLLPGMWETQDVRHRGMLELIVVGGGESRAAVYATDALFKHVPGHGNWALRDVPVGTHHVLVWHPAYEPVRVKVEVGAREVAQVHVNLAKPRAYSMDVPRGLPPVAP